MCAKCLQDVHKKHQEIHMWGEKIHKEDTKMQQKKVQKVHKRCNKLPKMLKYWKGSNLVPNCVLYSPELTVSETVSYVTCDVYRVMLWLYNV